MGACEAATRDIRTFRIVWGRVSEPKRAPAGPTLYGTSGGDGHFRMMSNSHVPVMVEECLRLLRPRPGETVVDATLGDGGHAVRIAAALGPAGTLLGLDRDPTMIERAAPRLKGTDVRLRCGNFAELGRHLQAEGIDRADAILLDLGVASPQLDDASRGLSYRVDGPLDMRLSRGSGPSAADWINRASEAEVARVFREFGEERHARRIARAVVRSRAGAPIRTTGELAEIIRRAVPPAPRRLHPARRAFQAMRIFINREIENLERFLAELPGLLRPGGRCVVLSYHSLEDRPVKRAFRAGAREGGYELLTPKPLRPASAEVRANPRSRSARLRAVRLLRGGNAP